MDLWISCPANTALLRSYGFGQAETNKVTAHDQPNPLIIIHFVWNFLCPRDRIPLHQVHSSWARYVALRADAVTMSLRLLKTEQTLTVPTMLCQKRARLHSVLLLRFDFQHGDEVPFLGGDYTNASRRFDTEWVQILKNSDSHMQTEYLSVQPYAAFSVQTQGAPLQANFVSPYHIPALRDQYDNHPAIQDNMACVEEKFAMEEWHCYHLHYHRWIYVFL